MLYENEVVYLSQLDGQYKVCSRCVMDTSAREISFNRDGYCNFCTEFLERSGHLLAEDADQRQERLRSLVSEIKIAGRGKRYDCIVGVSGGVDSSWVLVEAKRLGLRPLAVHMDNGWNSELAQNNIANLVRKLEVDLHTHVIDWHEYRKLMQAFLDSDVIDVELLYDNAMLAVNYRYASLYGVKYILGGTNQATEGMSMPEGWNWLKFDQRNIVDLSRKYGITSMKSFPSIGTFAYLYFRFVRGIKWISFLDFLPYNKAEVLTILEQDFGYKRYPYKHYESVFTRFYQGYILPRKFGIDKRRLHLSTLIVSGQMERDDALAMLSGGTYPSLFDMEKDVSYFLKKMKWTRQDLDNYIARPERPHSTFASEEWLWNLLLRIWSRLKKA